MKTIRIYDERFPKMAKTFDNKEEAVEYFIDYCLTNNTIYDGVDVDEIREQATLHEMATEWFGSWGRVDED